LISWKYSLEKINGELELAKKKKHALTKLFDEGKVSQLTYDSFSNEIAGAIAEIEAKQSTLVEKMRAKTNELEQQMKTLEFLLVNSEIRHVAGEIEEEIYTREWNVLSLGLETTKQELNEIIDAISDLSGQSLDLPTPPSPTEEETTQIEPETEKRLEIVMDTETTTSIETTVEEQPTVEEGAEGIVEPISEQEETIESAAEEESFRSEESLLSREGEEPDQAETSQEADTEAESEVPQEVSIEEETAQAQD